MFSCMHGKHIRYFVMLNGWATRICCVIAISSSTISALQVACASQVHPSQRDAEDHVLDHALAAHMSVRHMKRSEGMEREECYFSRFQGAHNAQAETTQSDALAQERCTHDELQDHHGMRQQQIVLAKPVRLL